MHNDVAYSTTRKASDKQGRISTTQALFCSVCTFLVVLAFEIIVVNPFFSSTATILLACPPLERNNAVARVKDVLALIRELAERPRKTVAREIRFMRPFANVAVYPLLLAANKYAKP